MSNSFIWHLNDSPARMIALLFLRKKKEPQRQKDIQEFYGI
jgi:hypothetical protein